MTDDPLAPLLELPGVREAVDASRAAVDRLLKERVLQTRRREVRTEALRRAAVATTALAGDGASFPGDASPGALRMLREVRGMSQVWGRAPLQALARLHTLAAAGGVPDHALGRPDDDPDTSARLAQLSATVTATRAPGVVVAAVVHGELLALAPFEYANGLVARAAQRLVLVQRGVDPDALTVPEEGLLRLGADRYRQAAAAFASGSPTGVGEWVTFVAAAVQGGATVGRQICAELS
ncbi:MAG TPA: oxidoreductase [Actinomycetes bacterium]|nr:oxidoreductase [Actinomycetes bacterium]